MANTYTQIHIQVVFAVRNRAALIHASWEEQLHKYITAIVQNAGHKMLQINGMPDHLHILIGMRPTQSLSELVKHIKGDSSAWINKNNFTKQRFSWQSGYGAFSYTQKELPMLINYIKNQKEHHRKKSFTDEYVYYLEKYGVDFDPRYIFDPIEIEDPFNF